MLYNICRFTASKNKAYRCAGGIAHSKDTVADSSPWYNHGGKDSVAYFKYTSIVLPPSGEIGQVKTRPISYTCIMYTLYLFLIYQVACCIYTCMYVCVYTYRICGDNDCVIVYIICCLYTTCIYVTTSSS